MAIIEIQKPMATVSLRWIQSDVGGRRSGPPTAPVYMATAVFKVGDEREVMPGWPATADQLSILVQRLGTVESGEESAYIDFLVPDLARPHLYVGAEILVMEGPRVVAEATVSDIFD